MVPLVERGGGDQPLERSEAPAQIGKDEEPPNHTYQGDDEADHSLQLPPNQTCDLSWTGIQ
jgi:hypothetical protein